MAEILLACWDKEGHSTEALDFTADLQNSGAPFAGELAGCVRLRHALLLAARGELQKAMEALKILEKQFPS